MCHNYGKVMSWCRKSTTLRLPLKITSQKLQFTIAISLLNRPHKAAKKRNEKWNPIEMKKDD